MRIARKVAEAAAYVRTSLGVEAVERAIALEAHMGGFSNELSHIRVLPTKKIPHHPESPRPQEKGTLIVGAIGERPVAVLEGRHHLYEGCLPGETAFPVRILAALGARKVIFVADGRRLSPSEGPGGILLVSDRLDLTGSTPLKGVPASASGPFIDIPPVPPALRERASAAAASAGVPLAEGVAALVQGPIWPTPAETRMLRGFGADVVSMALAPELAVAAHLGLETATLLLLEGTSWCKPYLDFCRALLETF